MGVATLTKPLEWKTRKVKSALLRLDVKDTSHAVDGEAPHWKGRVRGLNHAAAWIRMVEKSVLWLVES